MLTRYVEGAVTWVDCISPSPSEVKALMHEFSLHPLVAEELLSPSPKSKAERYDDSLYLILHFPALRSLGRRPKQEIDFCIGKHFLITVRYEAIDPLHAFAQGFEIERVLKHGEPIVHGGHLFASMMRTLYRALQNECDTVSRQLGEIEERIFSGNERSMVVEISEAGRTIHDFRICLAPHQEILDSLSPIAERLFGHEFSYYLRGVSSECRRVEHALANLRDSLLELRETNNSLLSTKQNEVMKTLTVLAFVFLPLSFIATVLGMSIPIPLAPVHNGFWIILGLMALIAGSFFLYFKRKGWL